MIKTKQYDHDIKMIKALFVDAFKMIDEIKERLDDLEEYQEKIEEENDDEDDQDDSDQYGVGTLPWAIKCLWMGDKVRRKAWQNGEYVDMEKLRDGEEIVVDRNSHLHNDWEIVE